MTRRLWGNAFKVQMLAQDSRAREVKGQPGGGLAFL